MSGTEIEWATDVWNPTRGCSPVSPGCKNCYAERQANRHRGEGRPYEGLVRPTASGPRWTGEVRQAPASVVLQPLRWSSTPRVVFVDSMSDLFHEGVSFPFIAAIFAIMAATPWHHYIILTKRAERLPEFCRWLRGEWGDNRNRGFTAQAAMEHYLDEFTDGAGGLPRDCAARVRSSVWPLPNVALGVSAERQKEAGERILFLLEAEAAVRLVSYEPALGPVDFGPYLEPLVERWASSSMVGWEPGLSWVIVGGESGQRARPFDVAWARSTVEQCRHAGVPVFVKQLGAYAMEGLREDAIGEHPTQDGAPSSSRAFQRGDFGRRLKLKDRKGGDWSEWPEDLRVREAPPGFSAAAVSRETSAEPAHG